MSSTLIDTSRSSIFRIYDPSECEEPTRRGAARGETHGYPRAWAHCPSCLGTNSDECLDCCGARSIKDLVRAIADNRCERCKHPFRVGQSGEWGSPASDPTTDRLQQLGLLDEALENRDVRADASATTGARPVHWSDCDEHCTHGGPVRWRRDSDSTWTIDGVEDIENTDPPPGTTGRMGPEVLAPENVANILGHGWQVQAAYRILTVHHLNEVKNDCRWWNLAALCQRCHLEIQGKVDMDRPWPWDHTEWFKPHAAGWYAQKFLSSNGFLRTERPREWVLAHMDELLELGRKEESVERMPL